MSRRAVVIGAVVVAAIVAVALVVAAGGDGEPDSSQAAGRFGPMYSALCRARAQAAAGDVDRARRSFFDDAHQPLHELASAVADTDRPVAARLLEAKEAVEADLRRSAPNLAADLDRLVAASREAMAKTGPGPGPCP